MAELMVDYITSLEGYGAAKGWPGLWGMGGPEYFAFLEEDEHSDHVLLMGANTYRLFAGFVESGQEGMEGMTARRKVVFSNSLDAPLTWENSELIGEDPVDVVRRMKEDDVPLRTIGSPSLCRALLEAGLVDRYRVVVFPVVNGQTGYDRMYDGWPEVVFDDVVLRTFDGTLQLFEATPRVLDGPPEPGNGLAEGNT
jgi:dihydrofolate reductase